MSTSVKFLREGNSPCSNLLCIGSGIELESRNCLAFVRYYCSCLSSCDCSL